MMVAMGRLGFSEVLERAYDRLVDLRSPSGGTLFDGLLRDGLLSEGMSQDGASPDQAEVAEVQASAVEIYDFVDQAFVDHLRAQRQWPVRTDVDRLERAGQALALIGIPVFEGVGCCDGCLEYDGGDPYVWGHADHQDDKARAVVYFFDSDIELALLGESLWMSFAVREPSRTATVAAEILEVLHAHGLDALWPDESVASIRVDMDWHCHRRGRLAAHPGPCAVQEPVVRVEITNPEPDNPLPWWGEYSVLESSVREFARVALPWLPRGYRVEVTSRITEGIMFLERDFDQIRVLGSYRPSGAEPASGEGLMLSHDHLAEVLSRWAVDGSLPSEHAPSAARGLLDVSYDDGHHFGVGRSPLAIPMQLAECRSLLQRAVPARGTFVVAHAFTGECVQMVWQQDQTVWMETPDPGARVSHGRIGTLAEAEELFCRLAEEGASGLLDMPDIQTLPWK